MFLLEVLFCLFAVETALGLAGYAEAHLVSIFAAHLLGVSQFNQFPHSLRRNININHRLHFTYKRFLLRQFADRQRHNLVAHLPNLFEVISVDEFRRWFVQDCNAGVGILGETTV